MSRKRYALIAAIWILLAIALYLCVVRHTELQIVGIVLLAAGLGTNFVLPSSGLASKVTNILLISGYVGYLAWRLTDELKDNPPNWHALFIDDWYITLAVLYLPALALGWMAYFKIAKRK